MAPKNGGRGVSSEAAAVSGLATLFDANELLMQVGRDESANHRR
jgi:hypothetical protein